MLGIFVGIIYNYKKFITTSFISFSGILSDFQSGGLAVV
jgi:hypothetical protein